MVPTQTSEVLAGAAVAVLYAFSALGLGLALCWLLSGRGGIAELEERIGRTGWLWLGYVLGQGLLGTLWTVLAICGALNSRSVSIACGLGFLALGLTVRSALRTRRTGTLNPRILSALPRNWYSWLAVGSLFVVALHGVSSLLPSDVTDALRVYLVEARALAETGSAEFFPYVPVSYGVQPLQAIIHWSALFTVSNETAVTVFDYLSAVSFLLGVGVLARLVTSDTRVVVVSIFLMLSTPGLYLVVGSARPDNGAAQYGVAAAVWAIASRYTGGRAFAFGGLHLGWSLASRYVSAILVPAFALIGLISARQNGGTARAAQSEKNRTKRLFTYGAITAGAAVIALAPAMLKNYLIVGHPLAPEFGLSDTLWSTIYRNSMDMVDNLSVTDVLLHPFTWTFAERGMLGHASPLFLGLALLFFRYRGADLVKPTLVIGLAGLVSFGAWLVIRPFALHTRWLLVPLALFAVPLAASFVAFETESKLRRGFRWAGRLAFFVVFLFLLLENRRVIYAVRYTASPSSQRAAMYRQMDCGYDLASWLNANLKSNDRVVLSGFGGCRYFIRNDLLERSETADELDRLWKDKRLSVNKRDIFPSDWTDMWRFYISNGFTYVIVGSRHLDDAKASWPQTLNGGKPLIVFEASHWVVMKIVTPDSEY